MHILTGDNPFTAKNISLKCRHISQDDKCCMLQPDDYLPGQLLLKDRPSLSVN